MKKAFTLIELLVVVSIIGVLAVALVPTIGSAPAKARDAARKTKIGEVIKAVEMHNIDEGGYPASGCAVSGPDTVHAELGDYIQGFELAGTPLAAACDDDGIYYTKAEDPDTGYWVYVGVENASSGTHCAPDADEIPTDCAAAATPTIYAVKR